RKIDDIDVDEEITLVDETQGRYNDDLMFEKCVMNNEEVFAGQDMIEKEVSTTDPITTAGEVVTTANVEVKGQGSKDKAYGSSKRYSAFIQILKSIDREDLETLWKLVKAKHGYTRPEEGYERVLWGDLKTMFEQHVEDAVWRNLREKKVLVWKLFDSCGVHFVRFQNLHVFMLVEKRYPLTPATITDMLNKKLQADHWNEMCYQHLKLITKQLKNQ
ncbi:hypothetical protein Tco_1543639, partial [Tanacetum coccineum]